MVASCGVCKKQYVKKSKVGDGEEIVSFHKFPRNLQLCTSWVKNIRRAIPDFKIPVDGIVCSRHFESDDFYIPGRSCIARLKEHAVPSVFSLSKLTSKDPKVASQPRPILPKPTPVSLDDSVTINDIFLPQPKKFEIGDKVFCRVGDKLVPGLVENVKSVNVSASSSTQQEFVEINCCGDNLEQLTVKSEVVSDTEEVINYEPQEDEVSVENEVFSYGDFHSDMNDIPECEIKLTSVKPQFSLLAPDIVEIYSQPNLEFDMKRIEKPLPEKYRIPLIESQMKVVEKSSQCTDKSDLPDHVIKRVEVSVPKKYLELKKEVVNHSQSFELDMSEIPEYESMPSGKRKIHQVPLIAAPKIKVVKYSECNADPQIQSLIKRSDDEIQMQNTSTTTLDPVVSTSANPTSKRSGDIVQIQNSSTTSVVSTTSVNPPSNVMYSIVPAPVNNLFVSPIQSPSVQSSTCPTFIMLPPSVASHNSSTLQLNITSDQLLASAGNAPLIILKPPSMSSEVSVPSSIATLNDDDNSLAFAETESISESNEGINIEDDDDDTVVTDETTAAELRKLRKILRERKLSMRSMSDRLKRRERRLKALAEKLSKFTSLSKPSPEHHAAEILSNKFPTCIQHFMSKIASISDSTDMKAFKYSQELKDFLVNLRFSNDPYSYLNSMLMNGLPNDDVLNEWTNSSGSVS